MRVAFEYVWNKSNRPIPEPANFTPEELRVKFQLERRAHLNSWDERYKLAPLTNDERATLTALKIRERDANVVRYAGREIKFEPGQVYEVPAGYAAPIVAQSPDKLVRLSYEQAAAMHVNPQELHFQTVEEAKAISVLVSSGMGANGDPRSVTPTIDYQDGLVRFGEGAWQSMPKA